MQSVFANAKFCRNRNHFAVFHPASQSSREDFLIYPLRTKCWFGSVVLRSHLCCFLLFSQAAYFRCERGPTQNLCMFVVVWHDSLDRCRWVLFASKKQVASKSMGKFSHFRSEELMLTANTLWLTAFPNPGLAWHVQQRLHAKSHFLRLSALCMIAAPFILRHTLQGHTVRRSVLAFVVLAVALSSSFHTAQL